MRPVNINAPERGVVGANAGNRVNGVRPYLGYGGISHRESSGSSVYHSMQVSINRRTSGQLTLGAAYTWGKSTEDGSSERADGDLPPNRRNIRAERGPSDFDRTQILTANFIWHLPRLARGSLAQPVLGSALGAGATRAALGAGRLATLPDRAARVGPVPGPATGTFGNLGRNVLRGPGVNKWDLALFKNFRFRGEMFNAFRWPTTSRW